MYNFRPLVINVLVDANITYVTGDAMTATASVGMDFEQARFNMIEQQIRPWEVLDTDVLKLFAVLKREDFVPAEYKELAFADLELPIIESATSGKPSNPSQTMLSPKIEARLLQEAGVKKTDTVLEVGTGTGFMAALLASQADYVYSVEIDPLLAEQAKAALEQAGMANVSVEVGDAAHGWAAHAPYNVIVISGSLPVLPDAFLQQLKVGGRLVAIIGEEPVMEAKLIIRTDETSFNSINLFETAAAPLLNAAQGKQFVF
jgi:protein-L-isoaspartate(D-aspartate) O-methyltransferase